MKSNYKALYELVERIDERNSDGSVTDLLGVSIDKCFIKSDYDSLIKREFPESSCKVAFLIGSALGKQNILTSDVFIAKRVQHFLNTGELVLLQQSKDGFYSSTIAAK